MCAHVCVFCSVKTNFQLRKLKFLITALLLKLSLDALFLVEVKNGQIKSVSILQCSSCFLSINS
jgi:hypothetical protein